MKGVKMLVTPELTDTTGKLRFWPDFQSAADWGVEGPCWAFVSMTVMTTNPWSLKFW